MNPSRVYFQVIKHFFSSILKYFFQNIKTFLVYYKLFLMFYLLLLSSAKTALQNLFVWSAISFLVWKCQEQDAQSILASDKAHKQHCTTCSIYIVIFFFSKGQSVVYSAFAFSIYLESWKVLQEADERKFWQDLIVQPCSLTCLAVQHQIIQTVLAHRVYSLC